MSILPKSLIVLVCGGRDNENIELIYSVLDELHANFSIIKLIHGAARGVDRIAGNWAAERGVPCISHPANWLKYGRSAGLRRNQEMLDNHDVDLVVAFKGGRGTAHMVGLAKKHLIQVAEPEK